MPIIKFIESAGVFIVRAYNAWKFDKCYSRVTIAKQSLQNNNTLMDKVVAVHLSSNKIFFSFVCATKKYYELRKTSKI